jgi:hypothetical protein
MEDTIKTSLREQLQNSRQGRLMVFVFPKVPAEDGECPSVVPVVRLH